MTYLVEFITDEEDMEVDADEVGIIEDSENGDRVEFYKNGVLVQSFAEEEIYNWYKHWIDHE